MLRSEVSNVICSGPTKMLIPARSRASGFALLGPVHTTTIVALLVKTAFRRGDHEEAGRLSEQHVANSKARFVASIETGTAPSLAVFDR